MSSEIVHNYVWACTDGLFGKAQASDRAKHTQVRCSNKGACGLHARGECVKLALFTSACPYGTINIEHGPTKRARTFRSWVSARTEPNVSLKYPSHMMAVVGEHIYLPYGFLPDDADYKLMPLDKFTPEWIVKACTHEPRSMVGDRISQYQRDVLPEFIRHLSTTLPELLDAACALSEAVRQRRAQCSHVGRKALVKTLVANVSKVKDSNGNEWAWDGGYLIRNAPSDSILREFQSVAEVRMRPNEKTWAVITDDRQVTAQTQFCS